LPGFDDRLKQHLEKVAPPADPSGAFDRILEKKIRRRLMRRFQAAGLALAVVAATVGGTWVLVRAFESGDDQDRLGGISPTPVPMRNGLLAYVSGQSRNLDIWTANPDGTRADNITAESLTNEWAPAWSPDGSRIAFVSDRGGTEEIYVMSPEGAGVKRLTNRPGSGDPAWSPDGMKIAYISNDDIFVMNSDGMGEIRLTSTREVERHPTWAPDGSLIAFARLTVDESLGPGPALPPSGQIYVMHPDGTEVIRLTEGPSVGADDWPDWSPDGNAIVFQRGPNLYVIDAEGGGLRRITDDENGATPSARPTWSPDGRKIVFERQPKGEAFMAIHTMDADGSELVRTDLTGAGSGVIGPDWQPVPVEVSAPPSPRTSPRPTPSPLPEECDASEVTGNFDGDGEPDTATVAKTDCLIDPGDQGDRFSTEYSLQVQWPPSEGIAPLPECRKKCRAAAAADLNGDGIDEFILQVDAGASTDFFQVYELPASEAFGRPATVAPPGSRRWPSGRPAEFSLFGSVLHFSALGCDLIRHEVIVKDVGVNEAQTEYLIHESILRFEPVDSPPFGRFTMVSERDSTEPYDPSVHPGDQFEPGDPCWTYGA
jgi:Tol biopolymer transport system component